MNLAFVRSYLYVPASDAKKCRKALDSECDGIIFDLEDAVSCDKKEEARDFLCGLIPDVKPYGKVLAVRVNPVTERRGIEDLIAVAAVCPDVIILPKANKESVIAADCVVSAFQPCQRKIGIIPLIESPECLLAAGEIVCAAPTVAGLHFGAEDFTGSMGIARTKGGEETAYARNMIALIARAHDLPAIDTPYTDYSDPEGLGYELRFIKTLGMTAKAAIHPSQLRLINEAFTPGQEEIAQAREIVNAYEEAIRSGRGACSLNGRMIDAPVVKRARKLIDRAAEIGKEAY